MALITGNPLIGQITGAIGDMVVVKHRPGVQILRKKPVRVAPATDGEKINQSRMRLAIAWAKSIWAERPELKVRYVSAGRAEHRRGFDVAKADFLRPPRIEGIELSEYTGEPNEVIRVRAVDDFEVAAVGVRICDLEGKILEEGSAERAGDQWAYSTRATVPSGQTVVIEATATDIPGHTGIAKVDHACGKRA